MSSREPFVVAADELVHRIDGSIEASEVAAEAFDERFMVKQEAAEAEAAYRDRYEKIGAWNLYDGLNDPRQKQENPWLFDGVLPKIGGGVIVLDSGEGKTWIQEEIGIAAVTSLPLFGTYPSRRQGSAALLLEEDDKLNAIDRGDQLVRGKRLTPAQMESLKNLHIINSSGLQLDTDDGRKRLREFVGDIRPVYLGLDPMAEFHSQPENDANKMLANLLRPLRTLANEFQLYIGFSHHTRKSYTGQDSDPRQSGRGTSAIKGWAASAWFLKNVGGVLSVEIKQRLGSVDFPAVTAFSLQRIENREGRSQGWIVTDRIDADLQARQDAAPIIEVIRGVGRAGILNRDLEIAFQKLNGKRLVDCLI
jgi:RecA-family ATPase